MKRILGSLAVILLLVVAIVSEMVARAAALRSRQVAARPVADLAVDAARSAEHLAAALRFRTVSRQDGLPAEPAEMIGLHRYLEQSFPRAHAALSREVVGGFSLLYTWRGAEPGLPPLLLLSHLDVVPVEAASEQLISASKAARIVAMPSSSVLDFGPAKFDIRIQPRPIPETRGPF